MLCFECKCRNALWGKLPHVKEADLLFCDWLVFNGSRNFKLQCSTFVDILRCALVRTLDHFSCDLAQSLQKYSRIMCSRKRKLILSLFTFWKEDLFMLKGQSSRNIGGQFCYKEACRYMLAYFASKSSWDSSRLFHHNLFTINSYSPSYSAMVLHLLKFVNFHVLQTPTKSDQTRVFIPFIFAWDKLIYIYGVNDLLERYGYS